MCSFLKTYWVHFGMPACVRVQDSLLQHWASQGWHRLDTTDFPCPSSRSLPIAPQVSVRFHEPPHTSMLGFWPAWSGAGLTYVVPATVCSCVQWPCCVQQIYLVIICLVWYMHTSPMQEWGWGITVPSLPSESSMGERRWLLVTGLRPSVLYSLMRRHSLPCLAHPFGHPFATQPFDYDIPDWITRKAKKHMDDVEEKC